MNNQTATPDTPAYFFTLDEFGLFADDLPDAPEFKEMYETEEQSYAALIRGGRDIRAEGAQSAIIFRQPPDGHGQAHTALIFYSRARTLEAAEALYITPDFSDGDFGIIAEQDAALSIVAAFKGQRRAGSYNGVQVQEIDPEEMFFMLEDYYRHRLALRRYQQFDEDQFLEEEVEV